MYDFSFLDDDEKPQPTAGQIEKVCNAASVALLRYCGQNGEDTDDQDEYTDDSSCELGTSISNLPRFLSLEHHIPLWLLKHFELEPETHKHLYDRLVYLARQASEGEKNLVLPDLREEAEHALNHFSHQLITDVQLALRAIPQARTEFLQVVRRCLRGHRVMKRQGIFVEAELWMIPISFVRLRQGVWPYYPAFDTLETYLRDVFSIPDHQLCRVGRSLWSFERLCHSACIDLYQIFIATRAGEGFDHLIFDHLDSMHKIFQHANQTDHLSSHLTWLPVLLEDGSLNVEQIDDRAKDFFDRLVTPVENILQSVMSIQDLEMGTMFPLWRALDFGCSQWNRRQFSSVLASFGQRFEGFDDVGDLLKAKVNYVPSQYRYDVDLYQKDSGEWIVRTPWLVTPDVIPERERSLKALKEMLVSYELEYAEGVSLLH